MSLASQFDVFLSHNSKDKPTVRQLGEVLTLLCGRNCQALWSTFLSFLVSPASLLMSIGLGRVHTGSVCEWVGFSPHSPCDCLRLLYTAHSPLSRADPVSLLGRLLTVSRRCWAPRSWGLCTCGVLLAS